MVRSLRSERRISLTTDMGLRRLPHPPNPIVIPSRSSATTSASVRRLSILLLHERVARLVALTGQVELEREALLEAVAALDVDGVDPVERLLGGPDHGRAFGRDLLRHLEGGVAQCVARHH